MPITLTVGQERTMLVSGSEERRHAEELFPVIQGHPERLTVEGPNGRAPLPAELGAILAKVVEIMAHGGTVTIGSLPEELTTTVAAEQIGVSRPTLMKMIRNGEIPARRVGSHHRVKSADVLAAKRERLERQRRAFRELREAEEQIDQS